MEGLLLYKSRLQDVQRFEIKAGLNRNTSSKEDISPINQRNEERREPRHRLVTGQQTAVLIYSTERCLILKRLS